MTGTTKYLDRECPNCGREQSLLRHPKFSHCRFCGWHRAIQELEIIVGGERKPGYKGMEQLAGLCIDPKTDLIVGAVPGTPAAEMDARKVEELTGKKWDPGAFLRNFRVPEHTGLHAMDTEARDDALGQFELPEGFDYKERGNVIAVYKGNTVLTVLK